MKIFEIRKSIHISDIRYLWFITRDIPHWGSIPRQKAHTTHRSSILASNEVLPEKREEESWATSCGRDKGLHANRRTRWIIWRWTEGDTWANCYVSVNWQSVSSSEQNDKFRVVRVKGATDAFLVDVKMCTEGQLKTIPESSDRYSKRRSHRRGRGNNRKESPDAVDSGSSDDSSGTRSSRSSGRSSCSGRSSR